MHRTRPFSQSKASSPPGSGWSRRKPSRNTNKSIPSSGEHRIGPRGPTNTNLAQIPE